EYRRQYFEADHIAGGDPDHAAYRLGSALALGGGGALDRRGGSGHGPGERLQGEGGRGRLQTGGRAGEECYPQVPLERRDMAAGGRLGDAQRPGRARQRALVQDGEEGPVERPVAGVGHAEMYSRSIAFGNFIPTQAGSDSRLFQTIEP